MVQLIIDDSNIEYYFNGGIFDNENILIENVHMNWRLLDNFPNIKKLNLTYVSFPNNSLEGIEKYTSISKLTIRENTDIDIGFIKNLKKLRYLEILMSSVSSLNPVFECLELTKLHIEKVTTSDYDLTKLTNLVNLRELTYRVDKILPLQSIENHDNNLVFPPKLKNVEITIDVSDLGKLSICPELENLKIKITNKKKNDNANMEWIRNSNNIKFLEIYVHGDLDLKGIDAMNNIKKFVCIAHKIKSRHMLSKCSSIEEIYIISHSVDLFQDINKCTNLVTFSLNHLSDPDGKQGCFDLEQLVGLEKIINLYLICVRVINIQLLDKLQSLENIRFMCSSGMKEEDSFSANLPHLVSFKMSNASRYDMSWLSAPKLKILNLNGTNVTKLNLKLYPEIVSLKVSNHHSIHIEGLETLQFLVKFIVNNCGISNHVIDNLISHQIKKIHLNDNNLTSFPFNKFPNLENVELSNNSITSINGIESCPNVSRLYVDENPIQDFSPICDLRHLDNFLCDDDYIEMQDPRTRRIIGRIHRWYGETRDKNIYDDPQNVHDSNINKSIHKSLNNLLKDPVVEYNMSDVLSLEIPKRTKEAIIEYCDDVNIHSVFNITFAELFAYVLARINRHSDKNELLNLLVNELDDAECMCFTGRFNRLINVLVGFYDDIEVNISDSSRISAIIISSGKSIIPYDPIKHKSIAESKLLDAGYTRDEIKVWLNGIE